MQPKAKIIAGDDARATACMAMRRAAWKAEGMADAECDAAEARERQRMAKRATRLRSAGLVA